MRIRHSRRAFLRAGSTPNSSGSSQRAMQSYTPVNTDHPLYPASHRRVRSPLRTGSSTPVSFGRLVSRWARALHDLHALLRSTASADVDPNLCWLTWAYVASGPYTTS